MRRALIACLHGNLIALEAVLKDIAVEGVDEIGCLGDMIGFGPDVVECIDLVRERCAWSLSGDYEAVLFMETVPREKRSRHTSLQEQRDTLKPKWHSKPAIRARWKWLERLDARKSERDVLYVHGSPRDPLMEYVTPEDFLRASENDAKRVSEYFKIPESIFFCAHTGRPGIATDNGPWKRPTELEDSRALIDANFKTAVNVGSVGRPRDRDPRSCYVVWDDVARTVTFHRVPYDLEATRKRIEHTKLGEFYWRRLREGR